MVFFNYALRKLNAKIVYYGPGLCGKTTNLQWIHDHFEGGQRGKMISLSTEGDRTIFFDLLPLEIGTIRGMEVTLQLYTVPGQVHYNSTRQLVLRGADGVVFVADSQRTMRSSNIDSLRNLQENLMLQGVDLHEFPHVLQFNKRDLRDLIPIEELDRELNLNSVPFFEAIATEGSGVQETLEGIVKLVMRSLRERYEPVVAPGVKTPSGHIQVPAQTVSGTPPPVAPVKPPAQPGPVRPVSGQPVKPVTPGAATAAPFAADKAQDEIPTGVYTMQREGVDLDDSANLTTASFDGPPDHYPGAVKPPADAAPPAAAPRARSAPVAPATPPRAAAQPPPAAASTRTQEPAGVPSGASPRVPPIAPSPSPRSPSASKQDRTPTAPMPVVRKPAGETPFADEPTATSIPVADRETFDFGGFDDSISQPPTFAEEPARPLPPVEDIPAGPRSPFASVGPEDLEAAGFDDDEAEDEGPAVAFTEPEAPPEPTPPIQAPPQVQKPAPVRPPAPASAAALGSVDDLVASVLQGTLAAAGKAAPPGGAAATVPPAAGKGPVVDENAQTAAGAPPPPIVEKEPEPAVGASPPPFADEEAEPAVVAPPPPFADEEAEPAADAPPPPVVEKEPRRAARPAAVSVPVTLGEGDPFKMPADDTPPPGGPGSYVLSRSAPAARSGPSAGIVQLGDNQLHLRLQGTGAIAESGQVRALDIEVPVPGSWVGNRRVTLQLRLTLSPVSEDDDGGAGGTS